MSEDTNTKIHQGYFFIGYAHPDKQQSYYLLLYKKDLSPPLQELTLTKPAHIMGHTSYWSCCFVLNRVSATTHRPGKCQAGGADDPAGSDRQQLGAGRDLLFLLPLPLLYSCCTVHLSNSPDRCSTVYSQTVL